MVKKKNKNNKRKKENASNPASHSIENGIKNISLSIPEVDFKSLVQAFEVTVMPAYEITPPRQIKNYRNSCYLNSITQLLFNCPFLNSFLNFTLSEINRRYPEVDINRLLDKSMTKYPCLSVVLKHFIDYLSSHLQSGLDLKFYHTLNIEPGNQEDSAEVLNLILLKIHEELSVDSKHETEEEEEDDGQWLCSIKGKSVQVSRKTELSGGNKSSVIGKFISGSYVFSFSGDSLAPDNLKSFSEPFFILPLDIPVNCTDIQSCFKAFAERELVDDYKDGGSSKAFRKKQYLGNLPPVLIIQLKRFKYIPSDSNDKSSAWVAKKIHTQIRIDESLEIKKNYVSLQANAKSEDHLYVLNSVVFHLGDDITRGHYTIAIRSQLSKLLQITNNNRFFYYVDDDSRVYIEGNKQINLLLGSHHPLDPNRKGQNIFDEEILSQVNRGELNDSPHIYQQPRTPYLLVYVQSKYFNER